MASRLRRVALVSSVAAVLALSGCGSGSTDGDAGTGGGGGDPSTTVAVPDALDFTAPLVGGGTFEGAALAGRPVAFWFWAPT